MPYRFALFVVAVNELPVTTLVNADTTSNSRTFLVAQWLRLGFPMQGREGLVQELRSHVPCGQKNRSNIVTNSIKIKKKILIASFHNLEHFSASENKHMDMHWQTAVTASAGEASANGAGLPECRLFAPLCVGQKFLVVTK